jgi:uncharacterized lipoprotein YajG
MKRLVLLLGILVLAGCATNSMTWKEFVQEQKKISVIQSPEGDGQVLLIEDKKGNKRIFQ